MYLFSASVYVLCASVITYCTAATQPQQPDVSISRYGTPNICPDSSLQESFKGSVFRTRSKIECAAKCGQDPKCKSWEFKKNTSSCQLGVQPFHTDCANTQPAIPGRQYYEDKNFCFNEGEWDPENGSCICHNATWGERCELIMRDCADWRRVTNSDENELQWIQPVKAPHPFQVWCRLSTLKPRVNVITRVDNLMNFNRTWEEYKAGFGDLGGSYWLGLDILHWLTHDHPRDMTVRISLMDDSVEYRSYKDIYVADEAHNYQLTFESNPNKNNNHSLHDCLSELNGANFSTYDRNNNYLSEGNCAARFGGGWWFSNTTCARCNVVGNMTWPTDGVWDGEESAAFWGNASGIQKSGNVWDNHAPKSIQISMTRKN